MPTIDQLHQQWMVQSLGFKDDDRIGIGGFESPSGRQWREPERRLPLPAFTGKRIGFIRVDPVTGQIRIVHDGMLTPLTDTDDQDWQDFISQLK